jgi:hypothetical protein
MFLSNHEATIIARVIEHLLCDGNDRETLAHMLWPEDMTADDIAGAFRQLEKCGWEMGIEPEDFRATQPRTA